CIAGVREKKPRAGPPCGQDVCGPCKLCSLSRPLTKFTHLCSLKSQDIINVIKSKYPDIPDNSCICDPCRQKFWKKARHPPYTPEKSRKKPKLMCFLSTFDMCDLESEVETKCELDDFNEIFSLNCTSIAESICLCKKHRTQISNFKINVSCSVCGLSLTSGNKKYSSLNLHNESVERLQQINSNFVVDRNTVLCQTCHRLALRSGPQKTTLDQIKEDVDKQIKDLDNVSDRNALISKACALTYQHVIKLCKSCGSFFLTDAYFYFLKYLKNVCSTDIIYHQCHRSKTWFMAKIMTQFGDALCINKSSRRKGIFFYVKDLSRDDIISHWHAAQAEVREFKKEKGDNFEDINEEERFSFNSESHNTNTKYHEIISLLNNIVRCQGKKLTDNYVKNPLSILDFGFQDVKSFFNPVLWNILCGITGSREEISVINNSVDALDKKLLFFPDSKTGPGIQKFNKRITLMFILQFILNDDNTYPFHIIVANCIKKLSNSSKLLKIMNNLGFSCSESTLERYLQKLQDIRQSTGVLSNLIPNGLTYVSLDNIDKMSYHAAVVADEPRSFHGTSAMAQQPKPFSVKTSSKLPVVSNEESLATSPSLDVKKPKVRKRLSIYDELEVPNKSKYQTPILKTRIPSKLKADHFKILETEKQSVSDLESQIFFIYLRKVL
ncbi:uncharacterized protein LOC135156584, partial [Lytechinus pictus]|uniref:uncharacterized protein LOC135156584 n=1 Tax=Lytechinus pictus TaxID=7653 RepID=UPI0030B9DA28